MSQFDLDSSDGIQAISATALPLPAGAATEAKQDTEITALQIIDDLPHAQNGTFVKGVPIMGQLDDTSTTAATEDKAAAIRITAQRGLHTNLRNNAGTEIGTPANPLSVDIASVTSGASTFSKKFRVIVQNSTIIIPVSPTYANIFSYSGSGLLLGFNVEFNSTDVVVRLVIDGTDTIFDTTLLSAYNALAGTTNNTARYQNGHGIVTNSSMLDFSLKYPIRYSSSVVISATSGSGLLTRNFQQGIFYLTKET